MKENKNFANNNYSKAAGHNACNGKSLNAPCYLQPKLIIGGVNDPLEQEADAVADNIMRMPEPFAAQQTLNVYPTLSENKISPGFAKEEVYKKENDLADAKEFLPYMKPSVMSIIL